MLNKVTLIGRLGNDPNSKYLESGTCIASFSVATSVSYVDKNGEKQEHVEWVRVVCFNKCAENCAQYLHKGSLVYVEGSLQTRKWIDPQGQPQYSTEVKAIKVTFLDKRSVHPPYDPNNDPYYPEQNLESPYSEYAPEESKAVN